MKRYIVGHHDTWYYTTCLFNLDCKGATVSCGHELYLECLAMADGSNGWVGMAPMPAYIDKIIEFPDDKTALAWFKLNY